MKGEQTFWTVFDDEGKLIPWLGAFRTRQDAMQCVTEGRMGFREYDDLGSLRARWGYLYRRGYRCIRVALVPVPVKEGGWTG